MISLQVLTSYNTFFRFYVKYLMIQTAALHGSCCTEPENTFVQPEIDTHQSEIDPNPK